MGWIDASKQFILNMLGCREEVLPVKCLGILINAKRLNRQNWIPLFEALEKDRNVGEEDSCLLGGRLILLNAVLSTLPTYYMSYFILPWWAWQKIDRIRRRVL